jgi:hypothetical protein
MTPSCASQLVPKAIELSGRTVGTSGKVCARYGGILALMAVACLLTPSAHADDLSDSSSMQGFTMPQREHDFIALFADAQKGAGATRSVADTRIKLQTRVIKFLTDSAEAKQWIGTLIASGMSDEGERWINVEIAPGIMIVTCHDRTCDPTNQTLMLPKTPIFKAVSALGMRERVVFNAHIFGGLIAPDAAMVDAPQMISRFDAIRTLQP